MKKLLSLVLAVLMLCGTVAAFASCNQPAETAKIGVQSGTTGEAYLKGNADMGYDGYSNISTQSYNTGALAVQDLLANKIDYVVIDNEVAQALVSSNSGIKIIDYALTEENYGIGVDKKQSDLRNSINQILANKKDEIADLYEKYSEVTDDNSANWTGTTVTSAELDASKADSQLVVATNAAFAPYEFKVGNAFAGIDMEIAKMIADELGMELVISDMDFEAVVSSIGKNGVDIALSGLTINPAREKVVDFSDPYEEGVYQVLIALKDDTTFDNCKKAEEVIAILKDMK